MVNYCLISLALTTQTYVSFQYDPLGRRISKTSQTSRKGELQGQPRTTHFVWEGLRLLQEIQDTIPLTYVYADQNSYEPLARIDGLSEPPSVRIVVTPIKNSNGAVRKHHETHFARTKISSTG